MAEYKPTEPAPAETPKPRLKPGPKPKPKMREIHAGGHVIMADPVDPTPDPIVTCSVCGALEGECVHSDPEHGTGWATEED